ncbi:hypothetical protein BC830DRAFT_1247615 [Chytriomyces sp. MP71]|nr:hypothetical protein BC830DRAFT_1247615 [Chytriomyces sp. MP71]
MMRVALVERVSGGAGAVFDALVGVLGDQDADVETRAKVAGILGGIRVVHRGMVAETVQVSVPGSEDALTSLRLRASILEETNTVYGDIELLNMNSYFDIVLRVLKKEPSWQVYSSVLNSLEAQLINMVPIFQTASVLKSEYAEALRSHLCEIVESEIAAAGVTNLPLNVKKSDIYLTVFRCLGALVSWHAVFGKAQIEALLRCFQLGLHRWPSTARYCLQTLTIFLTELPGPMTRITPDNLMKVSRITSSSMAPHILEYLSTLARLPAIHVNLTEADYKRIFGIALGYIDADAAGEGPVGGFVLQMAYHVIGVWFVQMRVEDRRRYVSFIIGHVLAQRQPTTGGGEGFDESVELVMDMLVQNSYVDCLAKPDTFEDGAMTEGGESGDGMASGVAFGASVGASKDCIERSWIQGNSVLTIRNLKMSGWAEVTVRRSSGTVVFSVKLENRARFLNAEAASTANPVPAVAERQVSDLQIESGSVTLPDAVEPVSAGAEGGNITSFDHELSKEASSILSNQLQSTLSIRSLAQADPKVLPLDPSFLLLQMSPYPQSTPSQACLPLPSTEEAYIRALKVLDRTPVSELHKIGVLYVAPGQNDEVAILRNAHGSASYTRFVCALGQMVRLQGLRRAHTGGLDTSEAGVDGSTCVVWEDASSGSQIVFHITTLMPTVDTDPRCNLKKRHVGNDFVSVLYDESGGTDIGFDTIPGQFNYINIMVTPLGTSTYADYESQRFHVVSKVKPDLNLPSLGVFSDGFVVTGSVLAGVVRRAALHANMLAVVAAQTRAGGGSFTSNARERLRQIKKLAERARKATSGGASVLEGDRSSILDFTRYF